MKKNNKWVTSDNRRLWVFRHVERLGLCQEIDVQITSWIHDNKMTSTNGGVSVTVRGHPGGWWYKKSSRSLNQRTQIFSGFEINDNAFFSASPTQTQPTYEHRVRPQRNVYLSGRDNLNRRNDESPCGCVIL